MFHKQCLRVIQNKWEEKFDKIPAWKSTLKAFADEIIKPAPKPKRKAETKGKATGGVNEEKLRD